MKPNKTGSTYNSDTQQIQENAKWRASDRTRNMNKKEARGAKRAMGMAYIQCILNHTYRTTETVNKSFTIVPITRPRATTIVCSRWIGTKHASDTKGHVYAWRISCWLKQYYKKLCSTTAPTIVAISYNNSNNNNNQRAECLNISKSEVNEYDEKEICMEIWKSVRKTLHSCDYCRFIQQDFEEMAKWSRESVRMV